MDVSIIFLAASTINTSAITGASWFVPFILGIIVGFIVCRKVG